MWQFVNAFFNLPPRYSRTHSMLYEITSTRPSCSVLNMRWFTSVDMDLYIWFHDDVPVRFQLSFDHSSEENALFWNTSGARTYRIDHGDCFDKPLGGLDIQQVAREFLAASEYIETGISDFVYARLLEFPVVRGSAGAGQAGHHPVPAIVAE
jgi:hypothetical protein